MRRKEYRRHYVVEKKYDTVLKGCGWIVAYKFYTLVPVI